MHWSFSTDLQEEMNLTNTEPGQGMFTKLENKPTWQLKRITLPLREFFNSHRPEFWNSKWNPPSVSDNRSIKILKSEKLKAKNQYLVMPPSIPVVSFVIYTDGSLAKDYSV